MTPQAAPFFSASDAPTPAGEPLRLAPADAARVVWFEGMTLDPHHFQQWDRHQERALEHRVRALAPHSWGLTHLEIDTDRLQNGVFVLTACRGVLPDGLAVDIPAADRTPRPQSIPEAFGAADEQLPAFLVVPATRRDGGNCVLQHAPPGPDARFRAETVRVVDENTGADERAVEVAHANVQVHLGAEPQGPYVTLPLAEIRRTPAGGFTLADDFVPPCLRLSASHRLQAITRTLVERLVSRSAQLAERRDSILAQRELSPSDVVAMGLLGTINAFLPIVQHRQAAGDGHPEGLYLTMARLAGQLSAYVPEAGVHPRDLPAYDHARPTACFRALSATLDRLLGGAAPRANYDRVALVRQRANLFVADLTPAQTDDAQLFLVVRSEEMDEDEMATELPGMLRIASPDTIDAVLSSYTRALRVEHTTRLPVGIPVDAAASYFRVRRRGPFWEAVVDAQALALFVPSDPDALDLQLLAVYTP